jgi:hypothetical protein
MKLVVLLALVLASPAAGNPWQLRCASMPSEQPTPPALRAAVRAFFPWVADATSLHAGPAYLVALSTRTAISRDGDDLDGAGYYLHRALVAIGPTQPGTVVLTGRRLGAPGPRTAVGFSTDGATVCTVRSPDVACGTRPLRFAARLTIAPRPRPGWRIVRTELQIGRSGCFQLTAAAPGLHATIPLAVPGPDYGTPGW